MVIHIHRWRQWEDQKMVKDSTIPAHGMVQSKRCEKCNKIKFKTVWF